MDILVTLLLNEPTILPSNQTPLGSLPARFRRERVLIVGCGDVGLRVAGHMQGRVRLLALTSNPQRVGALRARGVTPLTGNLDHAFTLRRLAGIATRVVHLAPPPSQGWTDARSLALVRALRLRAKPRSVVYGSTSGVYGDCLGEWVTESRAVQAHTPRAQRRVHAETLMRFWGGHQACVLACCAFRAFMPLTVMVEHPGRVC